MPIQNTTAQSEPVEVTTFVCDDCTSETDEAELHIIDGYGSHRERRVCEQCYDNNYSSCDDCGNLYHNDDIRYHSDNDSHYCDACYPDDESIRYRDVQVPEEIPLSTSGKIVNSIRPFGVELETRIDAQSSIAELSRNLSQEIGVESDGSIAGRGIEIQTPPKSGVQAEQCIKDVCSALNDADAYVDGSCGYHLHIDVKDIEEMYSEAQLDAVRKLWLFYIAYEDVIMSFLPPTRRKNNYCMSLRSDYHFREIQEAQNMERLEKIWYRARTAPILNEAKRQKKHNSRYRGVNMHTLFSERHLEIRFHSGTINPKKVLEWANLHTAIVDKCLSRRVHDDEMRAMVSEMNLAVKTEAFFKVLALRKDSEAYLRARQESFMPKPTAPLSGEVVAATKELLANELER